MRYRSIRAWSYSALETKTFIYGRFRRNRHFSPPVHPQRSYPAFSLDFPDPLLTQRLWKIRTQTEGKYYLLSVINPFHHYYVLAWIWCHLPNSQLFIDFVNSYLWVTRKDQYSFILYIRVPHRPVYLYIYRDDP